MYKDVLRSISEIETFPIVGILIFMGFFLIISIYAFKLSKKEVSTLENLPFEHSKESLSDNFTSNNTKL